MRRLLKSFSCLLTLLAGPALADGERPGDFDFYVLALSWSPSWCAAEGAARGADQCAPGAGTGFILHGLWPQYDDGRWPQHCPRVTRDPSRAETGAMGPLMGGAGQAWYQWKKHGRCAGLDPADYFDLARDAFGRITRPGLLRDLDRDIRLPADLVEEAFLEANPDLAPENLWVTCRDGRIAEVRVCLSRDGRAPVDCGASATRACRMREALFPAIR
ncbi:ribonuclease T2 family protein [Oceanomicrobium pacificus]|uniref:Ribonuclease T n=1 Tax=Oceanomicrobium pacificus TaxID=2692916 RepID=A0A6B0TQ85_9RHOB|nr:ribonuclease T2 [Oceanomicrobium pacificus]MXU66817.1 ribonuclease T [Oceanomicrobium pacificus]